MRASSKSAPFRGWPEPPTSAPCPLRPESRWRRLQPATRCGTCFRHSRSGPSPGGYNGESRRAPCRALTQARAPYCNNPGMESRSLSPPQKKGPGTARPLQEEITLIRCPGGKGKPVLQTLSAARRQFFSSSQPLATHSSLRREIPCRAGKAAPICHRPQTAEWRASRYDESPRRQRPEWSQC